MSAFPWRGQRLFPLQTSPFGGSKGHVDLGDDDRIRISHPLMESLAIVPLTSISAAHRVHEVSARRPVLSRSVKEISLHPGVFVDANVSLYFDPPVFLGPFRKGARQPLGLSREEEREGVPVDVLSLTVQEPDLLCAALSALGVRSASSEHDALVGTVGAPPPHESSRRSRERRTTASLLGLGLLVVGLAWMAAFTSRIERLRAAVDDGFFESTLLVAAGWAAAVAVTMSLLRRGRRAVRDGQSLGRMLVALSVLAVAIVAGVLLESLWSPLGLGLLVGAPVGLLWGTVLRVVLSPVATSG